MSYIKSIGLLFLLALLAFQLPPARKTTIYLIGDSTIAQKIPQTFPETGWGMPFPTFFDSTIVVANHAKNGRSTRTFLAENRWQPIIEALQPGDYVFIQFGHNDEAENYPDRYTPVADYRKNLLKFVTEARRKQAFPVLITPVTRLKFVGGKQQETHVAYSAATMEVAKAQKVPLIDLDKMSRDLLQQFGEQNSKLLFLQLAPGEHPNYPYGRQDNTHFSELGARKMAQLVVSELKAQHSPLADHLARPLPKNAVPPTKGPDAQPTTP